MGECVLCNLYLTKQSYNDYNTTKQAWRAHMYYSKTEREEEMKKERKKKERRKDENGWEDDEGKKGG